MFATTNSCAAFMLAVLLCSAAAATPGLTEAQARGKDIYTKGTGVGGAEIAAVMGEGGIKVPASLLLCANCHGRDGRGKPEGGVFPSNISWTALTKPYEITSKSGRKRPAYDEKLLTRAITMGLDSGGTKLENAMPRYQLTQGQATELLNYLKIIGSEPERGITQATIKLGVLLAPREVFPSIHRTAKETLVAFAEHYNNSGGVYGRRLELCFLDLPVEVGARAAAARDFIDHELPFALLASFIAGSDDEITRVIESREIPLVGTITLHPREGSQLNRQVFHLYPGFEDQAGALIAYAAKKLTLKDPRVLIAVPEGARMREVADIAARYAESLGWANVQIQTLPSADRLEIVLPPEVILWLGSSKSLAGVLQTLSSAGKHPLVLAPGSLVGRELFSAPPGFASKLFLSFPTLPSDQSSDGRKEYSELAVAAKLEKTHLPTGLVALASAKLLIHSLEKSGRDLRAYKLIEVLERLYEFPTGHSPPLTFTKYRRIGAAGAHIVVVDLKKKALSPTGERSSPPPLR